MVPLRSISLVLLMALSGALPACGARKGGGGAGSPHAREAGPITRPSGPMSIDEAREYMLALVNHDRAQEGLEPVSMDETAERAAQRHVEDMIVHGFTGHWGSDGSVPEQRYTEAGGTKLVQENAACLFDGQTRAMDPNPTFSAVALEKWEQAFMDEVPPNDGHRRNIIKPGHHFLGVGLAKLKDIDETCVAQEFVDDYGDFDEIPTEAKLGQVIHVEGEIREPLEFGAVGVGRKDLPKKLSAEELLNTSTYPMPSPDVLYSPPGYKSPKAVQVDGRHFQIDVPLDVGGKPGRYSVSIWVHLPDQPPGKLEMVSLRTILVR